MKRRSVKDVLDSPREDEYYVLVTRYYPMEFRKRGLKLVDTPINDWDRDLAPSRGLLKDFKSGLIGWGGYESRFRKEIPKVLVRRKIAIFEEDAKGKEVVLVCEEDDKEYPYCHTWIILDVAKDGDC